MHNFRDAPARLISCRISMVAEPLPNGWRPNQEFRFVRDSMEPSEYGRRHVIKFWQIKVGTFCDAPGLLAIFETSGAAQKLGCAR
jgi:hypothetical protein